jgi:hypothetical protein
MSTETIKISFYNWLDQKLRDCASTEERLKVLDEADELITSLDARARHLRRRVYSND